MNGFAGISFGKGKGFNSVNGVFGIGQSLCLQVANLQELSEFGSKRPTGFLFSFSKDVLTCNDKKN